MGEDPGGFAFGDEEEPAKQGAAHPRTPLWGIPWGCATLPGERGVLPGADCTFVPKVV